MSDIRVHHFLLFCCLLKISVLVLCQENNTKTNEAHAFVFTGFHVFFIHFQINLTELGTGNVCI